MTKITRRTTTGLLIAGSLMPGAALAQNKKRKKKKRRRNQPMTPNFPALAKKLEDRLNAGLGADCEGEFKVPAFDYKQASGQTEMSVVVRLDWPPGWRQRPLKVSEPDDTTAFAVLIDKCVALFDDAWPGCVT